MEFGTCYLLFGIWYLLFVICYLEFGIWYLEFGTWNLEFMSDIWQDGYTLHTFMCDAECKARLTAICHCMQESAGRHAAQFRLGYEGMQANNQAWVLNRMRVQIDDYPDWKSKLYVETWVQMMRGPFSQRYFLLKNENEETIGSANTFWVVIDATTHKPQRLKSQTEIPVIDRVPSCGTAEKIVLPDDLQLLESHRVRQSDLDLLHHVNNVKYLEWILDAQTNIKATRPHQIDLNFVGEARLNDKVEIYSKESDDQQFYQIKSGEKEICRAIIK